MELIIFDDIIPIEIFDNNKIYEYKKINNSIKKKEYGNYEILDNTKSKLDNISNSLEPLRRAAAKYYHDLELVKIICKKSVVSRSYFKLYEFLYFEELINKDKLHCMFLCEAPGGFIEAMQDMRRKNNLGIEYLTLTKKDSIIFFNNYVNKDSIIYGDITSINTIEYTINITLNKFPLGIDLVTADGGFDVKKYINQEIIVCKLLMSEIIIGLSIQKEGGMFIIKFFDMFTHNSIILYLILCSFYKKVKIIKPETSRNSNSERYLVCKEFIKKTEKHYSLIEKLKYSTKNFIIYDNIYTILFPDISIPEEINKIKIFNNKISNIQIETIDKSIKMVYNKNKYFCKLIYKKRSYIVKLGFKRI
jgi:23S rRNA U2552 (ribose-2'-O)-methylase RlmE/FtsJ